MVGHFHGTHSCNRVCRICIVSADEWEYSRLWRRCQEISSFIIRQHAPTLQLDPPGRVQLHRSFASRCPVATVEVGGKAFPTRKVFCASMQSTGVEKTRSASRTAKVKSAQWLGKDSNCPAWAGPGAGEKLWRHRGESQRRAGIPQEIESTWKDPSISHGIQIRLQRSETNPKNLELA